MAEIKDLKLAKDTFATLCRALDAEDWKYKKDEENLCIECGARGEDLPIEFKVSIDADRMLVILLSNMSFSIREDKRLDVAIAISAINNVLVNGFFDYNLVTGNIIFRMTNSFIESKLGEEVFKYMVYTSCATIDEYNDKFLMLSKGMLSLEQFLESLND